MQSPVGRVDIPSISTDIAFGILKPVCDLGKLGIGPCAAGSSKGDSLPAEPFDALVTPSDLIRYFDLVIARKAIQVLVAERVVANTVATFTNSDNAASLACSPSTKNVAEIASFRSNCASSTFTPSVGPSSNVSEYSFRR